jgi:hypothetical protein
MQALHCVVDLDKGDLSSLKRHLLLFDKIYPVEFVRLEPVGFEIDSAEVADLDFLRERGVIGNFDLKKMIEAMMQATLSVDKRFLEEHKASSDVDKDPVEALRNFASKAKEMLTPDLRSDEMVRYLCAHLREEDSTANVVPVCKSTLPSQLKVEGMSENLLSVTLNAFPLPDEMTSWQDILDFKSDMHNKQWTFRRFLEDLATKKLSAMEVKDRIEYSLNEYSQGMRHRHIKIIHSSVAALVVPTADLFFNFSGNHAAALIAAGIAINKLRIELMEGEMKAPGKECAYVFEAQKEFGRPS